MATSNGAPVKGVMNNEPGKIIPPGCGRMRQRAHKVKGHDPANTPEQL
jgi:hypothetical protein